MLSPCPPRPAGDARGEEEMSDGRKGAPDEESPRKEPGEEEEAPGEQTLGEGRGAKRGGEDECGDEKEI